MCSDLFPWLLGLAFVLGLVTVVGHGLWLLAAAVLRALFPPNPPPVIAPPAAEERPKPCARCGEPLPRTVVRCPACGLFRSGELAAELRELEVVARRMQALRDAHLLDPAVADEVYRVVEARQDVLLGRDKRPAQVPPPAPGEEIPYVLPVEEAPQQQPVVSTPTHVPEPPPVIVIEPPPAPVPPPPRRSLAEWLAAFMEERNILWGELLGGLLIVGCSVALVISLWSALEQIFYFPFLILAVVTGLLFGAGLYTLKRWRLETTSRGLLVIAVLLVPLNFLVLARLAGNRDAGLLDVVIQVAAVAGFAPLVWLLSRVLVVADLSPGKIPASGLATLAILGTSACQLLVPRLVDASSPALNLSLLALLPVSCCGLSLAAVIAGLSRKPEMSSPQARSFLGLLGVGAFCLAVAVGFLISWTSGSPEVPHALALPISLGILPVLVGGSLLQRKLPQPVVTERVIGTVAALLGGLGLLIGVGLAWPVPWALILVGGVNAVALFGVALGYRHPAAHVPGLLCLTVAYLTLVHVVMGGDNPLYLEWLSPRSGAALAGLAVVLLSGTELLWRLRRRPDALIHTVAAGVGAVLALTLVALEGTANPARGTVVFAVCSLGCLAVNVRWRWSVLSYAGGAVLLGASAYAVVWAWPEMAVTRLCLLALLIQATLLTVAAIALRRGGLVEFATPCRNVALAASCGAVVALIPSLGWDGVTLCAASACWLAALWLAISVWQGWPRLFAAFQAMLTVAVVLGVVSWLLDQGWVDRHWQGLLDGRSLQACGLALAGLSLSWVLVRLGLRSNGRSQALLNPATWPAVDRVVTGAVLGAQLLLAGYAILPDVVRELTPVTAEPATFPWPADLSGVTGSGTWLVLAVFAVGLGAGLWERATLGRVLGLCVVAVTVPVLIAGWFDDDIAVASALRWGMAICFVACAIPVWGRDGLGRAASLLRMPTGSGLGDAARRFLVAATVPPVLLLTAVVAVIGFNQLTPTGPASDSFFAQIGWIGSQITPLVLVTVGLTGCGVRERSPGYAFSAGLVATASLAGGYALTVKSWVPGDTVVVWQLIALSSSAWALVWLISRPWVLAWRESPERPLAGPLMRIQLAIPVTATVIVLASATSTWQWTIAAGSLLGWLSLVLTVAGVGLFVWRREASWRPHYLALSGLAVVAMTACTLEGQLPGSGLRGLLLGVSFLLLIWAVGVAVLRTSRRWVEAWACGMGGVVLGLAAYASAARQEPTWAAVSLGVASAACGLLALARRREAWALASSLLACSTVSCLVWGYYEAVPLTAWAVTLAQANLITLGASALTWLALRRRLYSGAETGTIRCPLLAAQVGGALVINAVLLAFPLVRLLATPQADLSPTLLPAGWPLGWLAVLLPLIAGVWCCRLTLPWLSVHVVGVGGLLLGVVAACGLKMFPATTWWGSWLPHHVLTLTWTLLGFVILVSSWRGSPAFPVSSSRRWVEALCGVVVALLLRGVWADPSRPYVQCVAAAAVGGLLGAMALWSRRWPYVYCSGLTFNLVGFLVWQAWLTDAVLPTWLVRGPGPLDTLIPVQVLCLSAASLFWLTADLRLRRRVPSMDLRGRFLPFAHAAVFVALHLLAFLALAGLVSDVTGEGIRTGGLLAWAALALTVAALALCLRDVDAPKWGLPLLPLYASGLVAIGLGLHALNLSLIPLAWSAALALAAYVLATAVVARLRAASPPPPWFLGVQTVTAVVATALGLSVCVTAESLPERLAGAAAVLLLLPAGVLMAGEPRVRYGTLTLGVLALMAVGLAFVDPAAEAPWLHRGVVLMVAVAVGTVLCSVVLPPLLAGRAAAWVEPARRTARVLAPLLGLLVLVVMVQEFALYDPVARRAPLQTAAVVVVAVTLALLIASLVYLAVNPKRDPFLPADKGRTSYVYAAEVLLVLLLVHLRLSIPDIFPPVFGQYWPLTVMLIAFLGVGLGELFRARGVGVLASPLRRTGMFLPVLPLVAYLVRPLGEAREQLGGAVAGLQPFLRFLDRMPPEYAVHTLVWFLVALLYLVVALRHRSTLLGILAALAANFGLWVVFGNHAETGFLVHPQLWLAPLGLILLLTEWLHRSRLPNGVSQGLRYGGALLIYVASTADMFIDGLGNSVLLPIVLALLAVAGVLVGILLRVRAFLFLGSAFLLVVVLAQIWHAAVDREQTWLWWASGIVLGAAILTLFALFEKRRNDMLRLVDELKRWD